MNPTEVKREWIDEALTADECAVWLKMSPNELRLKSSVRVPDRQRIPAWRFGDKTLRYHPRTIITWMQKRCGFSLAETAASFGRIYENNGSGIGPAGG